MRYTPQSWDQRGSAAEKAQARIDGQEGFRLGAPLDVCFVQEKREELMIEVGAKAPDFTLRSHAGEEVSLSQFRGDKWVVLHTFPLAFTGG